MLSDVLDIVVVEDDGDEGAKGGRDNDGGRGAGGESAEGGGSGELTTTTTGGGLGKRRRARSTCGGGTVTIVCEDSLKFVFPPHDCLLLPIMHTTAEELAIYLYGKVLSKLNANYLIERGVDIMEVTVSEAVGQEASFRLAIPRRGVVREEGEDTGDAVRDRYRGGEEAGVQEAMIQREVEDSVMLLLNSRRMLYVRFVL
jgi:hypothetical protein